jgi:hypothetical protein
MNIVIEQGDCLEWLKKQPDRSVDFVFGSPPYEQARLYLEDGENLGISRKTEAWVKWMIEVTVEALRVSKGMVSWVVEGQTRKYQWSAGPALLMADLHRMGICLRKPPIYHRVGVAGGGGRAAKHEDLEGSADWLRNDYEFVICATRGGALPWADTLAMGHAPKYAPGGEFSNRLTDGTRVNQWGKNGVNTGSGTIGEGEKYKTAPPRPSHVITKDRDKFGHTKGQNHGGRKPDGTMKKRRTTRGYKGGDTVTEEKYEPPAIANPGNVVFCKVGGNLMGHPIAHKNEAPFPEQLAEFFVRSFCPPGGTVCDPFSGSGTTAAVCVKFLRNFRGCDLRKSQVQWALTRIGSLTPPTLFGDDDVNDAAKCRDGSDQPSSGQPGVPLADFQGDLGEDRAGDSAAG